ncbi:MAG: carboxypeptidase-like regulatory domain-containing protein [Chitinophagaceae bacterium]|nr:carboxypeptidase-like regulatory domain-containing protein [Chitinophagaceae bacterium]
MKNIVLLILFVFLCPVGLYAVTLKGKVTDEKGEPLPFASVYIKGTTKGTTTNVEGQYSFDIEPGKHTIVCQYVGYQKEEVALDIQSQTTRNFQLKANGVSLKEVTIKNGENPANAIMKKTIKKRSFYNKQIDGFRANAYIKGNFKLDEVSDSKMLYALMGKNDDGSGKSNKEELESQKGIIYLSESFTEVAYKRPDKLKVYVKSSKVSGQSKGYGFSDPLFINLYDNNVDLGKDFNQRGFISPIAETAMLSYKYELLSAYMEDGKLINRIKVIPRRKFEPLFSGIIDVVENEWRLHSADLQVSKEYQLDVADTIHIQQVFVPVKDLLMVKDQNFLIKIKILGFGITGRFVNVFTDYVFDYDAKNVFNKFEKEYEADALKHQSSYWDTLRPVPLDKEEAADYIKKDSIEVAEKNKPDTVKPSRNTLKDIVFSGYRHQVGKQGRFSTMPVIGLNNFNWNTAEGFNYTWGFRYNHKIDEDRRWSTGIRMRYGVSNEQFNAKGYARYQFGKTHKTKIELSGGRYVYQYNNEDPVNELINSCYTLFYGRNYLKTYQAWFGRANVNYRHISGFTLDADVTYQDRYGLSNTNLFSFRKNNIAFTPNYPIEKISGIEPRHQALMAGLQVSYQPGRKFIKYPDRIEACHSKYPTFSGGLTAGLPVLNSDVDYLKWRIHMQDDMDLHLWGTFKYNASVGGFIYKNALALADYTHFNGNQIVLATPYLNSFQLSPYYANSNTESFYTTLHAEHHFYGLLTNKVPLFRNLKWYLVAASNAYYVNQNNNYIEVSAGLENVGFKLYRFFRVDAVVGYTNFKLPVYGIRVGISGGVIQLGGGADD